MLWRGYASLLETKVSFNSNAGIELLLVPNLGILEQRIQASKSDAAKLLHAGITARLEGFQERRSADAPHLLFYSFLP